MEPRPRSTYDFDAGRIAGLEEALGIYKRAPNMSIFETALKEVIRSLSKEEPCTANTVTKK